MVYQCPNLSFNYCASQGAVPPGIGNIAIVGGEFLNLVSGDPRLSNYHLSSNSTLRDAGNPLSPPDRDGSRADIGIYGGQNPYNEFGIPDFPFVTELNVSPTVPQNGVLWIGSRGRVGP